ncbi:hypothetical protein IX27_18115 [Streptomyces sp. JS01]|uniref:hypothetical protein n=1 Tax=Streptomyces sp. JS01 TaxID=1525753 RepID=UPI0005040677|nr:hypothetical protein [Streptomyces sp. JS01]KFK87811.1 hypothetical protein IX27_18115 [Streptomyces sp. JS01]
MSKEVRDLIKKVEAQGFEVTRTKKGHWMVKKNGVGVTTIPGTASDHRSLKNVKAQLKRAGYID